MGRQTTFLLGTHRGRRAIGGWILAVCLLQGSLAAGEVDYERDVKPLLKMKCQACHGPLKQESELRLDTGEAARKGGDSGPAIVPGDPSASELFLRVSSDDADERMPPEGEPLTKAQVDLLRRWIEAGAPSPADEQPQVDPRDHWAYQPIVKSLPGETIDTLIESQLKAAGIDPNPAADRRTLIRRLFLDMHGLPPTVEQVQTFIDETDPQAWARLVDEVLASPRYGERWAQHWLDVVRYADTHGFEVNTPRENAWHYRDYVINAFNRDLPYDEFIMQQIAGDACGVDVATGFLVAAPVLLPGQIGKDDASKRLARQDALDEIIVGTSATFLGMTLGCARCHDHKFDPLSQQDYYALQAFFTGVEYGERPIQDAQFVDRQANAAALNPRIKELETQLKSFEPFVFRGRTILIDDEDATRSTSLKEKNGHGENPEGSQRGYRDDPGTADRAANISRGRYTWWANVPGEDVFAYTPCVSGRFGVWISWGAHGSGAHTRNAQYLLDHDGDLTTTDDQQVIAEADQYYPSGVAEGETEQKPLWSGLLSAGVHDWTESTRLVVRGGQTGTAISADVIVLQEAVASNQGPDGPVLPRLRGPVNPLRNTERFEPLSAKFVRFTTLETIDDNRHEPCIDEIEIYAVGSGENVALAEHGTQVTSSGDYSTTGRHQLRHVNDGQYGNGRSWISNEKGGGWVQLELPAAVEVERVVWGRDREGKFKDRLPVRYRIEVSLDGEQWTLVADQTDRVPVGTPHDDILSRLRNRPQDSGDDLSTIAAELEQRQSERDRLLKPQLVYGGTFREADQAMLLARGDPEQPLEPVSPSVPSLFATESLSESVPDQQRRVALARWIASSDNPLTARVMVNRIWQYHFGRGLVETASDFGLNGARPSNPELIDWLARQFIDSGWSVKQIHRLILTSQAYQRSGQINNEAADIDADVRLLWRFPTRRLEAEAIRDSILSVSGELNLKMGGPGFNFFKTRGGLSGFPPVDDFGPDELRRMIYAHKIRMEPAPVFGAFDCPDAGQPMPTRSRSTTAIQALNLFNSPFVVDQAEVFAQRIEEQTGGDAKPQVIAAFRSALGREPTPSEQQSALPVVRQHGLATLCRVLFNCSEFLFIP